MRDLRADWKAWSRLERISAALLANTLAIGFMCVPALEIVLIGR
jgi:hypothetical protein